MSERKVSEPMHVSDLLYTSRFDFPSRRAWPTIQLMVATVPRSGSTAFCLELWRTGLLGAPLEYANLKMMNHDVRWKAALRRESDYWRLLQRARTGPNGVFSYKFFVQGYVEILKEKPKLLHRISPTHVIYLTREDKLAQAVSYSRAIRSGAWFANVPIRKPCEYDGAHIRECLDALSVQEQSWEHVFDMTSANPLRVTYEGFLASPRSTVQAALEYVVPGSPPGDPLQIPPLEIQRDMISDDWKHRFLTETVCRSDPAPG